MKHLRPSIPMLFLAFALHACADQNNESDSGESEEQTESVSEKDVTPSSENTTETSFDINSISVSTADIGDFPFFEAPEGTMYINDPKIQPYNEIFFPINGKFEKKEGKVFMSHIHPDKKNFPDLEISIAYILKSYEEAILAANGVLVNDTKLSREQTDFLKENATYLGKNGSIDYWNSPVKTYIIRREDGDVYVQLDAGRGSTSSLQILQEKPFKQTIKNIRSEEIARDLANSGKAVLYINFDVNKASLTADGKSVVKEIEKVLQSDKALKISIEGHTDNTGNTELNKKLSEDRALTVMNELTTSGIDKNRLKAAGYGAEKPMVANDTEENKAKNRRVELIKTN